MSEQRSLAVPILLGGILLFSAAIWFTLIDILGALTMNDTIEGRHAEHDPVQVERQGAEESDADFVQRYVEAIEEAEGGR